MSNMTSEWARLLVGSLARAGIRDVIVSPGSRSTPFAWAALHEPSLTVRVVIDERAAAFYAVGQAKLTGRPSLLVCTSGSAVSNYLPALVEATHSAAPVVVLSADRPFELQACGANQTIDQARLFGSFCKEYIELGLPDRDPQALRALARSAARAVARSTFPDPGPVHLNARAKKPLEPQSPRAAADFALRAEVDALLGSGPTRTPRPRMTADPSSVAVIAARAASVRRGLLVLGALPPSEFDDRIALGRLALLLGFPVLCEAPSQLRLALPDVALEPLVCDGFDLLFGCPAARSLTDSDFVLQLGASPTSAGYERFIDAHPELERHVVTAFGWPDPQSSATSVSVCDVTTFAEMLCAELAAQGPAAPELRTERLAHRERFRAANALVWRLVEAEIASSSALSEGGAVRIVGEALPNGSLFAVGNSLPIREIDRYVRARAGDVRVLCQRGASGIDGLISTTAGAASAFGRPTTLLIGDVSLLHDIGGLLVAQGATQAPFVVVVLNNAGGRIFEQLPIAKSSDERGLDAWLTPYTADFRHAAALYGHAYERAEQAAELKAALVRSYERGGVTLVEAVVDPHSAAKADSALQSAVARALEHEPRAIGTES